MLLLTTPPAATSPGDVTTASQSIDFTIPAEWVNELLQFGFYSDVATSTGQSTWTSSALYDNVVLAPQSVVEPPPTTGGYEGDFEGIPIPLWALVIMAGFLAYFGASKLRSNKRA